MLRDIGFFLLTFVLTLGFLASGDFFGMKSIFCVLITISLSIGIYNVIYRKNWHSHWTGIIVAAAFLCGLIGYKALLPLILK